MTFLSIVNMFEDMNGGKSCDFASMLLFLSHLHSPVGSSLGRELRYPGIESARFAVQSPAP